MIEITITITPGDIIDNMSDDDFKEIFRSDTPRLAISAFEEPASVCVFSQSGDLLDAPLADLVKDMIDGLDYEDRQSLTNLRATLTECIDAVDCALGRWGL